MAYADDFYVMGPISKVLHAAADITGRGKKYGFHVNPKKSKFICCDPHRVREVMITRAASSTFNNTPVARGGIVLGNYIGEDEAAKDFIDEKVEGWSRCLKSVIEAGREDPHGLYTAVTKSVLRMPNYVQRGMGGAKEQYAPIDDLIQKEFLPSILGDASRVITSDERELYALPCRMGGLGVGNVGDAAKQQHVDAIEATSYLTKAILGRTKWSSEKYSNTFTKITSQQKSARHDLLEEKKKVLKGGYVAQLPLAQKKACENAMDKKTHYFLTLPPSEAQGTYLTPEEFHDGISIRYGRDPVGIPALCTCQHQCPLTLEHALTCATGGNIIGRHNMLRDELEHLAATATAGSQWAVEKEVWITDNLKTDLQIRNLEGDGKVAQIDVRICHPAAPSYQGKTTQTILSDAEKIKKITYDPSCRRRGHKFIPFIITTDGALGVEANVLITKLAAVIATKLKMQKSKTMTWARSRLATALVRASSACIRGSRGSGARNRGSGVAAEYCREGVRGGESQPRASRSIPHSQNPPLPPQPPPKSRPTPFWEGIPPPGLPRPPFPFPPPPWEGPRSR